jgi:23S rRNA (cytosine1962-C5)-methyltransferase
VIQLTTPQHWKEYELLDCGNFLKLERFGKYITIRPEPQAIWSPKWSITEWQEKAHVQFIQKTSSSGDWKKLKQIPDQWQISYTIPNYKKNITFRLGLTSFKHVGIFPEQAFNWDYIFEKCSQLSKPKFLNLFAYTGGASLAAKAAGADVIHVDSIQQVITWSRENMQLSGLSDIRWVVEDALKFVKREVKRGNTYQGIILDPPAFGHGPNGEKWILEKKLNELVSEVLKLLAPDKHFLIINAYSLGLSALVLENLFFPFAGNNLQIGELYLQSKTNLKLPLGVWARFEKGLSKIKNK